MPGFSRVADISSATNNGAGTWATWRKSPSQTNTAGIWFDLSMSPGNPVPQYYAAAPLVSVRLAQSTDGGLFHGASPAPAYKYLRETTAMTVTSTGLPMPMILLDYLLFYPFIDEGTTDEQALTNSTTLSRYTDGVGVQIMAVSVAGRTGGQSFFFNYTIVTSATASLGSAGPFIPLQIGDSGVRSIQSVTMTGTDVGLFTLVLVKPLIQTQIRGIDAPVENDHFLDKMNVPRIYDDAYLNWICLPQGALNATALHGMIRTCWN
jgi:hypothetical protein